MESISFLDTCNTNGSSLVQMYNILVLVTSVFLLSVRPDPSLRIVLILLYLGIISQYLVPINFNIGKEYTDRERTVLKYGMIALSSVCVVMSVMISKFLFKDLAIPTSIVGTNVVLFSIPGAVIPIIELSQSKQLSVDIGLKSK